MSQSKQNRRDWFKTTMALTAGFTFSPLLIDQLIARPLSKAERNFFKEIQQSGTKVKLNSNENPYGPSEKVQKALMDSMSKANRYAFAELDELKKLIAEKEGVSPEFVMLGAGSGELLCQTGVAFGLDKGSILSAYPTFPLLMNSATQMSARWDKVDLNDKLEHDYQRLLRAIQKDTRLVFICNPNNPTGTIVNNDLVQSFCEEAAKQTMVYADEAYIEFLAPEMQRSMVRLTEKTQNIIVSKTFSKIYGLAGLRIGYIIAHPDVLKKIGMFGDTISPSQTALAAAKASLGDESYMQMVRDKNEAARNVLTNYLDQKQFFYGKSLTNVVFFPAPKSGQSILKGLDEKGYLIRVWEYQGKEWCRVSIGTENEMKGFVQAFEAVI